MRRAPNFHRLPWRGEHRLSLISRLLVRLRGRHLLVLDLFAVALAVCLAFALRFDLVDVSGALSPYLPAALVPLVVRPLINIAFGLYSRTWRYASVPDLLRILLAAIGGTAAGLLLFYGVAEPLQVPGVAGFPRSFWIIEGMLSLAFFGGVRFLIRAGLEVRLISGPGEREGTPTLLYGAGQAGVMMARSAMREPQAGLVPVGFLDDDPARKGTSVVGLPVFGGVEVL